MEYNEYDELTTKLAGEIISSVMEKEASGMGDMGDFAKAPGKNPVFNDYNKMKGRQTVDKIKDAIKSNPGKAGAIGAGAAAAIGAGAYGVHKLKQKHDSEKAASIEEFALEKAAEYYEQLVEELSKEASGMGDMGDFAKAPGKNPVFNDYNKMKGRQTVNSLKDTIKAHPAAAAGIGAAAAAGIGAAAYGVNKLKKKPSDEEIANKAAEMVEEANMMKQAAIEVYQEAEIYVEAAERALQEIGYGLE